METLLLTCQLGLLAMNTVWLALGLRDNLVFPEQNRRLTNMVLLLDRMEAEYPDFYAQLSHRRILDADRRNAVFRAIVIAEIAVSVVMCLGLLGLLGALLGLVDPASAQALALAGAFGFTMIFSAFLVGGNHFAYWLCFKEQQYTHFFMIFWGLGTMLFLVAGR